MRRLIEITEYDDSKMTIVLDSGINADGFSIKIGDKFEQDYAYGYNASWDKSWANDRQPFVSDIILELMRKYNISPDNVEVINGYNTFKGSENTANIDKFIRDYCIDAFNQYKKG